MALNGISIISSAEVYPSVEDAQVLVRLRDGTRFMDLTLEEVDVIVDALSSLAGEPAEMGDEVPVTVAEDAPDFPPRPARMVAKVSTPPLV